MIEMKMNDSEMIMNMKQRSLVNTGDISREIAYSICIFNVHIKANHLGFATLKTYYTTQLGPIYRSH